MSFACPPSSCGSNSPTINVFPYNGLHADGCKNKDGAALAKFSLLGKNTLCDPNGLDHLYLDVAPTDHGYELVAKDARDTTKCKGTELVGVTFAVTLNGNATTLRISQMATTDVSYPKLQGHTRPASKRTVYLITPAEQPANSLCMSRPPGVADSATPVLANLASTNGKLSHMDAGELAAYAIIIPGALYTSSGQLIPESITPVSAPGNAHRWFNIACASDALAQTELSGVTADPIVDTRTATSRLPALHMFAAQYCDGISATSRGTPIAWVPKGISSTPPATAGAIEAQWDENGATCVSHARLWVANKTISLPSQLLGFPAFSDPGHPMAYPMGEKDFLSKLCPKKLPECSKAKLSDTLTSYTRN